MTYLYVLYVVVYLASVRTVGRYIATRSWEIWDDGDNTSVASWIFFPLNRMMSHVGNQLTGHPETPIRWGHGIYRGDGFGVLKASPWGKTWYLATISLMWPLKQDLRTLQ
jgi:hypothetical protein